MLQRGSKDISQRSDQPLQELQRRRFGSLAEMDRLFDEVFRKPFFSLWSSPLGSGEQQLYPPVDIYEDGESVTVKAEIPGIKKEDIEVQITQDAITISGRKSTEEKVEERDYFRVERSFGNFTRTFQLPVEIQSDKARANFKDGILEVRIPKSQEASARVKKVNVE